MNTRRGWGEGGGGLRRRGCKYGSLAFMGTLARFRFINEFISFYRQFIIYWWQCQWLKKGATLSVPSISSMCSILFWGTVGVRDNNWQQLFKFQTIRFFSLLFFFCLNNGRVHWRVKGSLGHVESAFGSHKEGRARRSQKTRAKGNIIMDRNVQKAKEKGLRNALYLFLKGDIF